MRYLTVIFLFLIPYFLEGQLITSASSATNLVQNTLIGTGVTVTNVQYAGSPAAIGHFTANNTNLGINEGIIITTGTIFNTPAGPQGPNNQVDAGVDNNYPGFPPLNSIAGSSTHNAAVLQFDFVPFSDSVEFKYVFASEEFLEYVNYIDITGQNVNDVFAFFISGPGIVGQQNIARLPNNTPVAINNIHPSGVNIQGNPYPALNQQYYVDNNGGATIQYDGFTTVLTARSAVQCGQTYHLTIAIADVGDGIFDSGIFLEANSLTSFSPISIDHQLSNNVFNDEDVVAEDCVTTTITLYRDPEDTMAVTIPIQLSGIAIEGVDYSPFPPTISFAQGATTTSLSFVAFQDLITEGPESLIITFAPKNPCGETYYISIELTILDVEQLQVEIIAEEMVCPGDTIELFANVTGGGEPYAFVWSTGETSQSIFVSPGSNTSYNIVTIDDCLLLPKYDTIEITVPVLPPLVVSATADITEICPYIPTLLESSASGGLSPYSYQWSSTNNPNIGTTNSIVVTPSSTTTYNIEVSDYCGTVINQDIVYTITSPPLIVTMSPNIEICPGDSALISVSSSGGFGQHFYQWWHSGETTPSVWVKPSATTSYSVSVSDECQTFTVEGTTTVTVVKPTADFTITSQTIFNNLPIQFMNLSQDATNYQWYFGDGNQSNIIHPQNTYQDPGPYYITLIAIDDKGCIDSIRKLINIEEEWYVYIPNTFTPDGDRVNSTFSVSVIGIFQLEINIFNRWGEIVFTSNEPRFIWDGTYNGIVVPDGTYTYSIQLVTNSGRERKIVGHINVLR